MPTYKLVNKLERVSFFLYLAVDNWVRDENARAQNIWNSMVLYNVFLRIDYKENQFANKPREIQKNGTTTRIGLKFNIGVHFDFAT